MWKPWVFWFGLVCFGVVWYCAVLLYIGNEKPWEDLKIMRSWNNFVQPHPFPEFTILRNNELLLSFNFHSPCCTYLNSIYFPAIKNFYFYLHISYFLSNFITLTVHSVFKTRAVSSYSWYFLWCLTYACQKDVAKTLL